MARPPNPYTSLIGRTAVDRSGVRIGQIRQVIVDDVTGRPEWVVIATGVLGARQKLVPVADEDLRGALAGQGGERRTLDSITIAMDAQHVRSAPRVELVDGQLSQNAEETLYVHYQMIADETPAAEAADLKETIARRSNADGDLPQRDPLGEIARAASGVLYDLEWLDRMVAKLATNAFDQDRERQSGQRANRHDGRPADDRP